MIKITKVIITALMAMLLLLATTGRPVKAAEQEYVLTIVYPVKVPDRFLLEPRIKMKDASSLESCKRLAMVVERQYREAAKKVLKRTADEYLDVFSTSCEPQ